MQENMVNVPEKYGEQTKKLHENYLKHTGKEPGNNSKGILIVTLKTEVKMRRK